MNASPPSAPIYGTMTLRPFGIPRPLAGVQGKPAELGALAKTWGLVQSTGQGWFTATQGAQSVCVFGDIGSPAPTGFVTVTGIVSETDGPNGEQYGIRVRRPSDVVATGP